MSFNSNNLHYLIIGFSEKTGLSAAKYFASQKIPYSISDNRTLPELASSLSQLPEQKPVNLYAGIQTSAQLEGITHILLSPGVPRTINIISEAQKRDIPITNDLDLAAPYLENKVVIGITGTDGKTTTTMLTHHLVSSTFRSVCCGNNGYPILDALSEIQTADVVVVELSSYMLEDLKSFSPTISTITNIAEDHLDRYQSFEHYQKTKFNITKLAQRDHLFIKNLDNQYTQKFTPQGVEVRTFGIKNSAEYSFQNNSFCWKGHTTSISCSPLVGVHNIENTLCAIALADCAGVSADDIEKALCTFSPLKHRMEPIDVKRNITVINDSKATTLQSVLAAVNNYSKDIVLILGGRGKGISFKELNEHQQKFKNVICYGEAGPSISEQLHFSHKTTLLNFYEAVKEAWNLTPEGGVLLLSPGATSWDQFANYEERGNFFKKTIQEFDSRFYN